VTVSPLLPLEHARLDDSLRSGYLHYRPAGPRLRPPLVLVHGITRDHDTLAAAFLPVAARLGIELVLPIFTTRRHGGYQRLRTADRSRTAAEVLDDILDHSGVSVAERVCMFGFSGGGQFAHRYALLRPERVAALSVGAPGWYTFPDPNQPFPYGVAPGSLPGGASAGLDAFLRLPVQVLVGERDTARDQSLRCSSRIDRQQGPNRVARAMAWIEALRRCRPEFTPDCEILPGVGHRFESCVANGRLVQRVMSWLAAEMAGRRIGTVKGRRQPVPAVANLRKGEPL